MSVSNSKSCTNVTIESTWEIKSENNTLKDTVTINTSGKSAELDEIVQLETCVQLEPNCEKIDGTYEPCSVTITLIQQPELINRFSLVSEARFIEVFGSCGEYLTTCNAEYVDDFENCAVYMATCNIKPTDQLTIKFQKTKHPESLWIYAINISIVPRSTSNAAFSSINFNSVNEILKEIKAPLSENAVKCKAFLQAYGASDHLQNLSKNQPPNSQMLMKMLEAGYLNPLSETTRSMSKCLTNFAPFLSKDVESKTCPETDVAGSLAEAKNSSDVLYLKTYIDNRFSQLETKIEKLEQNVRDIEQRQSDKLDEIIRLLSKT